MADTYSITDQYGRPIRKKELTDEIAAPSLTGVRSILTGYPADGLDPERLAAILRGADQGQADDYLELAEQIEERDLHYTGVLGTRKRSVAQLEITVDAASDDPAHVKQADWVRDWLDRDELQDELFDMLDALGKGLSYTEIIWDMSEGQWRPDRLAWRHPAWFNFDRTDGSTPLLKTEDGDQPLPAFKFIVATMKAKSGLPIRGGLARLAAWAYMFKKYTERDWAIFTQTYGQPVRVGKYGPSASERDKDKLWRAVANIAGDCAAIIPESMTIDFVDTTSKGTTTALYKDRADWYDQQVSKGVLGQTATTDAIAGGHAVGREHRLVQEDIERADAVTLRAILNTQLVRPMIILEFGPQTAYPRLQIGQPDQRDPKSTIEAAIQLADRGARIKTREVTDLLGFSEAAEDDEVLQPTGAREASPETLPPSPQSAAPHRHLRTTLDVPEMIASSAEELAAGAQDAMIDRLRQLIETAGSLEDVRDGLLALEPDLPAAGLAELMGKALVLAELAGRSEIANNG